MSNAGILIGIRLCAVVFSAFGMRAVAVEEDTQKPPRGERLIVLAEEFIKYGMLFKPDDVLTNAEKAFLRAVERGKEFKRDIVHALGKEQRDEFAKKWKEAQDRHAEDEEEWKEARANYERELTKWKENRKTNGAREAPTPPLIPIKPHKYQVLKEFISEWGPPQWPTQARLRGDLITWLGTELDAKKLISRPRIQIEGCRITGTIDWEFVEVPWSLECVRCDFENAPNLVGAKLKSLRLSGSLVPGIRADRVNVTGSVFLKKNFHSRGEVRLLRATIGGTLDCANATMENQGGAALNADGMNVKGSVFLNGNFHSRGEVRLLGATIGGNLECDGATIENPGGKSLIADRKALSADGMNVTGSVFLNENFRSRGEVRFVRATIAGNLDCGGATMENAGGKALTGNTMNVTGTVFLRKNFHADGRIDLIGARMGNLYWYKLRDPTDAILDLRHAKAGTIWIGTASPTNDLPNAWNLFLHGFTYDSIDDRMHDDAKWWIDFIKRQPSEASNSKLNFLPQPYKQAARVLKEAGHSEQAKRVLIAMENRRRDTLGWARKVWSYALEWSIGYGHAPGRPIWMALFVIIVGFFVFRRGDKTVRIVAAEDWAYEKEPDLAKKTPGKLVFNYPRFNALIYSIDVFIPLVSLTQAEHWIPRSGTKQMTWLRVQKSAGWIVTPWMAAGLPGLVGG